MSLRAATVRFNGVVAVDSVDCTIPPGTSLALIGPNGSGKTTVLRLLAGMIEPDEGSVERPAATVVAYVNQHASTPSWLPIIAREVVEMGRFQHLGLLGRFRSRDHDLVRRSAERLQVADLLDRTYGDLSGGQRQRIRLAQALAQEPTLLLLDEPITGLDLTSQRLILDLIDDETERGTSVVITTHSLDEARHCRQVLLLRSHLVACGPPEAVLTPEHLRTAFGDRLLGDHADHAHDTELIMFDDHG